MNISTLFLLCTAGMFLCAVSRNCEKTILYLPLDERYTTRQAFLNLADLTPFCILTPGMEILPSLKEPGNVDQIHQWVDENVAQANAMIISAEMYLYGGLISSRISNDSTAVITHRANKLMKYSEQYPELDVYVSNVVMRIPSYDGDFEEPWYWKDYGLDLYTYSFYSDKYSQLQNISDMKTAKDAISSVPPSAVEEFTWRRERNHNITLLFLDNMSTIKQNHLPAFHYFYTTLDDSAEFGFNIREAEEIETFISTSSHGVIPSMCPVYPGADEVHLAMLSLLCVNQHENPKSRVFSSPTTSRHQKNGGGGVVLSAVFRDPSTVGSIPGYEGLPMIETLQKQVAAAGGRLALSNTDDVNDADAFLLVNNFSEEQQIEATQQPLDRSVDDYAMFDDTLRLVVTDSVPGDKVLSTSPSVVGFCDNRYANGADAYFVKYMADKTSALGLEWTAYAGWNTNGNTIGTVVANTIILSIYREQAAVPNSVFNSLRILEDLNYQSGLRQTLIEYADLVTNTEENSSYLTPDLEFYKRYVFKVLSGQYMEDIAKVYGLTFSLDTAYFPWNRTFEIGFTIH